MDPFCWVDVPCHLTDVILDFLILECLSGHFREVQHAIFNLDPDSVAGSDNFTSLFFWHGWVNFSKGLLFEVPEFFFRNTKT